MSAPNPLLTAWTTPFGIPPFDIIHPDHFPEAFETTMATHRQEIEAIAANPAPPTFPNTIEALQRAGRDLDRVANVFDNLVSSQGGPALEAVDRTLSPLRAQHGMQIALNPHIFHRVAQLHRQRDTLALAVDQARLLDRIHLGLIRSGAALAPAQKARMVETSERLATLHTEFGQNVLHDEKAWSLPLTEPDLEALPDFLRTGLAQAAKERGTGTHTLTLSRSLIEPFLAFSPRRDLRQIAHQAWIARGTHPGPHDNRPLIPEILALRQERAQLLGYPTFAHFRLADTMAATPHAVEALLAEVWVPAKAKAAAEAARLTAIARAQGFQETLAPWDWRFYAEQIRRTDYAIDEAAIKPYFVLDRIQQAAFDTATRLFGLTFAPVPNAPHYHPDIRSYEVRGPNGHVGIFLADPYARPDKRSGAWMSSYRDQETLDTPISPIIINNNNFSKADPPLLSFDDAETLFHEFGHALHGLLSHVRYPAQSGTSVRRDFVELPSQIYEHWIALPETLAAYARHHQTTSPLPDAQIAAILAARSFNQGFATVEYTSSALIDMALHQHPDPASIDIERFETQYLAQIGMPYEIGLRHRPTHFQHIFAGSGYAAGYYSYLWAEILDADGFDAFLEAKDPFDPPTAARLKTLLSAGDTKDPMELYTAFRGRPPSTTPLLRSRGLTPETA